MEVKRGTIVRSLAGHDKGDFQVIIDFNDEYVKVCDGKYRPLERPKKKKLIHVKLTNTVISEDSMKEFMDNMLYGEKNLEATLIKASDITDLKDDINALLTASSIDMQIDDKEKFIQFRNRKGQSRLFEFK